MREDEIYEDERLRKFPTAVRHWRGFIQRLSEVVTQSATDAADDLGVGPEDSPTFASETLTGPIELFAGQGGGWRDIIGQAVSPPDFYA